MAKKASSKKAATAPVAPAPKAAPVLGPVLGFSNNEAGWLLYDGRFCYVFKDDELVPIKKRADKMWYQPSSFGGLKPVPSIEKAAA